MCLNLADLLTHILHWNCEQNAFLGSARQSSELLNQMGVVGTLRVTASCSEVRVAWDPGSVVASKVRTLPVSLHQLQRFVLD